jgi:hypothetical protein
MVSCVKLLWNSVGVVTGLCLITLVLNTVSTLQAGAVDISGSWEMLTERLPQTREYGIDESGLVG